MWAIIGGSGFEKFDSFETVAALERQTPFGQASTGLKKVRVGQEECLFLSRHGENHERLPSEVNYRANIFALKQHGAKAILSFSAVGSLRQELRPGDMVIPTQYIDRTKGVRRPSFCGDGVVGHVSLAKPVCETMAARTLQLAESQDWQSHLGQTYVCIEGPYFSTMAESHHYREIKADIIGMTNFPEFALAREAGLSYLPCCFVTDYDCWDTSRPHVTLDEVLTVMRQNNRKAFAMAQSVLSQSETLLKDCDCGTQGLAAGLMTPFESLSPETKAWLEVLMR
ncbi:MAG: MTAP family purine nucleoside phosphorylase [Bdellovibrionales bacterium]